MNLMEIGGRIKLERKKHDLSQEKLAEMIYVSPHYIYEIERGMKAMSLETFINICETLELSADYVLFGEQPNKAPSLYAQLEEMSGERRLRAENAFSALLPYIR